MPYMLPLPNMEAPPPQSSRKPQQLMRTVSISILVMSLPVLYVSFLHVPPAALFRDTTFWFLMSNSIIIVIAADSGMLFFGSSSSSSCSSVDVDNNETGLPFVASGGGEPAAGKNDHFAVSAVADEVVATMNDDHAYALVLRDDQGQRVASGEPESRDICMVVSPPPSNLAVAAAVPLDWNEGGGAKVRANRTSGLIQLKASRSLAREERLSRRHSHRPSSHSRALVPVQDKSVVVVSTEDKQQLRRTPTTTEEKEKEKESEYSMLSNEELNRRVEEFITKFNREMRLQLEREQQLALAAA